MSTCATSKQDAVVRHLGHRRMQVVDGFDQLRLGRVLLAGQRGAQRRRPLLVDPRRRQVGDGDLDPRPQLGEVTQRHAAAGQIDGRDLGDRVRALAP